MNPSIHQGATVDARGPRTKWMFRSRYEIPESLFVDRLLREELSYTRFEQYSIARDKADALRKLGCVVITRKTELIESRLVESWVSVSKI